MIRISRNLKFLRTRQGMTQKQLAEKLGLKTPVIGAYEEGRAHPPLPVLVRLAGFFQVSLDALTHGELHKPGSLLRQGVAGREVLAVTVDVTGTEQVELVTQKAAAGYLSGYQDPEFVRELPKIQLPVLPRNCTVRAFEIRGDSMLPIRPGSIVFGRFVESLAHIKNGKACILVTQQDGIVFKRVFHDTEHPHNLLLVSDNTRYAPYRLPYAEVREVWEALGVYSAME